MPASSSVRRLDDAVVEAGDRDVTVAVLQLPHDPGRARCVDRVGRDPAVRAGMQVDGRALSMQLHVQKAAQRGRQRRVPLLVETAVPDEDGVGLEPRAVGAEVAWKRFAADLLLALEQEAQVDRGAARGEAGARPLSRSSCGCPCSPAAPARTAGRRGWRARRGVTATLPAGPEAARRQCPSWSGAGGRACRSSRRPPPGGRPPSRRRSDSMPRRPNRSRSHRAFRRQSSRRSGRVLTDES